MIEEYIRSDYSVKFNLENFFTEGQTKFLVNKHITLDETFLVEEDAYEEKKIKLIDILTDLTILVEKDCDCVNYLNIINEARKMSSSYDSWVNLKLSEYFGKLLC